jgi:hypothetical protein
MTDTVAVSVAAPASMNLVRGLLAVLADQMLRSSNGLDRDEVAVEVASVSLLLEIGPARHPWAESLGLTSSQPREQEEDCCADKECGADVTDLLSAIVEHADETEARGGVRRLHSSEPEQRDGSKQGQQEGHDQPRFPHAREDPSP